ncbi:bifunctional diguanylate cyclase/phosphodiesterase [Rhizobium oryziradicis]|uniref:Diguanylate cyclase n=1 Tax=Rhizobium oryziradicis TaxID=1867956 RepID=A0A1Q8ZUA0_9HYPH|nr:EAL domain-containing protein [Rhizobium oryziradicis]OLP45633.1 diguanylate cyclase [Rhizobium oryziradicis]
MALLLEMKSLRNTHFSNKQIFLTLALVLASIFYALIYLDRVNSNNHLADSRKYAQNQLIQIESLLSVYIDRNLATLSDLANATAGASDPATADADRLNSAILSSNPHFLSISMIQDDGTERKWARDTMSPEAASPMVANSMEESDSPPVVTGAETQGVRILPNGRLQLDVIAPAKASHHRTIIRAVVDGSSFIANALKYKIAPQSNAPSAPMPLDVLVSAKRISAQTDSLPQPLWGPIELTYNALESREIPLLNGTLHLIAQPKGGWSGTGPETADFRLTLCAVGLVLTTLFSSVALLLVERNRNRQSLKSTEERHRVLAKRFELAMNSSNIGIWELDDGDNTIRHDSRATQLHGLNAVYANSHDFNSWLASVHPDDRSKVERHLLHCRESDKAVVEEYRIVLKDGSKRHIRSVGAYSNQAVPSQTAPGRVTGILLDITSDVAMQDDLRAAKEGSDIKNAELELALDDLSVREQQLEELSERFELALDSFSCGVWQHDFSTTRTVWDDRMYQLYNVQPNGPYVTEAEWLQSVHKQDLPEVLEAARAATEEGTRIDGTHRVLLADGTIRYVRSIGQLRIDRNGGRKLSGVSFDVTADVLLTEELRNAKAEAEARNIELELTKNRIEYNALHDPLTGLANRRKFDRELDALTALAKVSRPRFTILHLDLDRFKEINDTLGHAAGDAMLVNAADVLRRHVNYTDLVARIGGDEFVVLLRDVVDEQIAADLASRIIKEMNIPYDFEGFTCRFGVSIGIAASKSLKADARKTLIDADLALYEAKRKGRNRYEFFTQSLQANIVTSRRVADELLTALERDEITAFYQPQFCANTMQLIGAEALVRWQHPERGLLPTSSFLKTAEDLSIMAQIDKVVLDCTLRDRMRWTASGIVVPKISVNVSSKRLHDSNLVESLQGLSITPGSIAFELVESIFLDDNDETITSNIETIKALGIDVEIDDFGTGHTSMISLLKIKPKRLKIDRQLVMPIIESDRERALVKSIIEIAKSLGVGTIAEGVETQTHADILRDLGCDLLQGYAFAPALSSDDFSAFALSQNRRHAS